MASFGSTGRKLERSAPVGAREGGGGDDPTASTSGEVTKSRLQREGIEYDRRQIRRKLRERLQARGQDLDQTWMSSSGGDAADDPVGGRIDEDESVYDDTEFFPWRQRESAVYAAAVGGRTEGRMEGFDSLERALQAHTHNLHYGRGIGWSQQKPPEDQQSGLLDHRAKASQFTRNSMTQASGEWTSFSQLDAAHAKIEEEAKTEEERLDRVDRTKERRSNRQMVLLNTCVIMAAVLFCFLFAYYIETVKIDAYETYLPEGYQEKVAVGTGRGSQGAEPSDPLINDMSARRAESPDALASPFSRIATGSGSHRRLQEGPVVGVPRELVARRQPVKDKEKTASELMLKMERLVDLFQEVTAKNILTSTKSPQHRSLMWMAQDFERDLESTPISLTEGLVQRYALAVIFFATNGHSWRNQAGFLTHGVHECHWHVVNLGASRCKEEKVRALQLANNNLVGDLPPEIALLSHLTILDLTRNSLFGRVEPVSQALQQSSSLKYLALEGNSGLEGDLDICQSTNDESGLFFATHKSSDCLMDQLSCPCCTQCCGWDKVNKAHYCEGQQGDIGHHHGAFANEASRPTNLDQ